VFHFDDLTPAVRLLMLDEFEADLAAGRHYESARFTDAGRADWPRLMRQAMIANDPEWLADRLDRHGVFVHSKAQPHGAKGTVAAHRTPENASEVLAEGEFNRYYCRAVCRVAIERDGGDAVVEVYRGKDVTTPRPESKRLEGTTVKATELLADLRQHGATSKLGVPGGFGSGLTVRFPMSSRVAGQVTPYERSPR
jgi:hypothetical protein